MYKDHLPLFKGKNTYLEDTCIYSLNYKCLSQLKCLFPKDMLNCLHRFLGFHSIVAAVEKFQFGDNYEYNVSNTSYVKIVFTI